MPDNATHVTPASAASMLGVAPESVRRYCNDGRLQFILTEGGHRRISRDSVAELIASRTRISSTVTTVGGA